MFAGEGTRSGWMPLVMPGVCRKLLNVERGIGFAMLCMWKSQTRTAPPRATCQSIRSRRCLPRRVTCKGYPSSNQISKDIQPVWSTIPTHPPTSHSTQQNPRLRPPHKKSNLCQLLSRRPCPHFPQPRLFLLNPPLLPAHQRPVLDQSLFSLTQQVPRFL
jgi:hypothetical protein